MDDRDIEPTRPSPDQLLHVVKEGEKRAGRGKLKVFLGMVAGVGKTFSMLTDAHRLKSRQIDILVGWIDTHGRKETEELVKGLPVLPRKKIVHKGVELEEMDIDRILEIRPALVLVDELAHSNVPGSRHTKRYLDVLEILDAGIDVYTTLNVQHLESRCDTVKKITGITVYETVPDSFLDRADEVLLVDLPPDELIKRLEEGKIYPRDRVEAAARNFFRKGNLTALREIALRLAAERVDRELRNFKILHGIESAWKTSNRLMVTIFASPYSESLIRWTRRIADSIDATWIGAYIESERPLTETEQELLSKNLALVTQLGGEVITTKDEDSVNALIRIARQNNVNQIIVGKSKRNYLERFFSGGSIVDKLIRHSGDIDIYVVAGDKHGVKESEEPLLNLDRLAFSWEEFFWVLFVLLITWGGVALTSPSIQYHFVGLIFLFSVSISGLFFTWPMILLEALIFSLIHDYFYIPPIYSFSVEKSEDVLMLIMYFVTASTIGHLTSKLSRKERLLRSREEMTSTLFRLAKDISIGQSREDVIKVSINNFTKFLPCQLCILLPDERDFELLVHNESNYKPSEKDLAVARWVYEHNTKAGLYTDTLPSADATYYPLLGKNGSFGVMGIRYLNQKRPKTDERYMIEAFITQLASGLEREAQHEEAKRLEILEESQKLYRILLGSVSQELQQPISTIQDVTLQLKDILTKNTIHSADAQVFDLVSQTTKLNRIVENLLDITRIDSGIVKPRITPTDISQIIQVSLSKIDIESIKSRFKISFDETLPRVLCDIQLTTNALNQIIRNAIQYSPAGSRIDILAFEKADSVAIQVRDRGAGLPRANPSQVFERFYRGTGEQSGGIGIGLTIAKGFIELQKGKIKAENAEDGGAIFTMILPKENSYEA